MYIVRQQYALSFLPRFVGRTLNMYAVRQTGPRVLLLSYGQPHGHGVGGQGGRAGGRGGGGMLLLDGDGGHGDRHVGFPQGW